MAEDLYKGEIDGIPIDYEKIEDGFEKSISKYEFPYRDGALLEDMGQKARNIRIRCYFFNETYLDHIELINHLESTDISEFTHPKYGLIKGSIEAMIVRHDERELTAEVDLTFVENLRGEIEPAAYVDVKEATEEVFSQGQDELMHVYANDVVDELGAEGYDILGRELDSTKGILEQFNNVSLKASDYVKQVDTYVRTLEGTLTEIANPANSLIATINYGVNLPGRVIGSIARTIERYAILYDSLRTSPARFLDSLKTGLLVLEHSTDKFAKHTKIASAQRRALETACIYKADEEIRVKVNRSAQQRSFDVLGNYIKAESPGQIMTVNELELTLGDVRTSLQESIDASRQMESLKTMALTLLTTVNTIKLEREKIVAVSVDNELPLHIVCLKYGLPYNDAERIMSINNIKNPNFTRGEINIYAG